jgi:hypothetical protein
MILILDNMKFLSTGIASVVIYISLLTESNEKVGYLLSRALFISGWILMGFSIGGIPSFNTKSLLAYSGTVGIIYSAYVAKYGILSKNEVTAMMVISWLLVCASTGINKENLSIQLASFAFLNIVIGALNDDYKQSSGTILIALLSLVFANSLGNS